MRWVWRTVEVVRIQCNMDRQVESFVSIVRRDLLDRWFLQGLILPICYFFHLIIIILIIIISKPRPEARGKCSRNSRKPFVLAKPSNFRMHSRHHHCLF